MAANWEHFTNSVYSFPELGFSIDISKMRLPDGFFQKMEPEITKAFEAMSHLEEGAIVNPDEGRMVGHYWLRNPAKAPHPQIADDIRSAVLEIKEFSQKIHRGTIKPERAPLFKNVLLVGIGGSALGPQLLADALWTPADKMKVYYVDNTDPDGIQKVLMHIGEELETTLVLIASKSGGTPETRNGCLEVAEAFRERRLNFGAHTVAITSPGSKLDQQSKSEGWLASFPMWDWVGGRTSIFSAVGLLPGALQGVNIDQFLEGAQRMDELTRVPRYARNPAAILSLMWYAAGNGVGAKDMVVLPYKDRLCLFSKYLQQLVMESLGKEKDLSGKTVNQGIAVYGNKGSTDQHAYVQQLREGLNNFFATFIQVLDDYCMSQPPVTPFYIDPHVTSGDYLAGFVIGTRQALYDNQRDSITVTMDTLSAKTLGMLIALYERTVGFYATLININAYHQPGVEAGKKAAAKVITLQQKAMTFLESHPKQELGVLEIAEAIDSMDDAEALFKVLEHLAMNPTRRLLRVGDSHPKSVRYSFVAE